MCIRDRITLTNLQNEVSLLKLQNENNINASKVLLEEAEAYLELQKANHELLIAQMCIRDRTTFKFKRRGYRN